MITFALPYFNHLMKTKKTQTASSIRFRRWSRAGYAIFCSLACTVTIGCICVSISDKSLQKAVGVSDKSLFAFAADTESKDKSMEIMELEAMIHPAQETVLSVISTDSAAACYQNTYIYFIHQNG